MQAMFNCNIKLECKEPSGKQHHAADCTTHIISGLGRTFVIFKSFIHSWRIHTVCFDHTYPHTLPPNSSNTLPLPSTFFFCPSTMCAAYIFMDVDFHLEDNDFPGATLCKKKKKSYSPSPSSYRLPIGPQLGVGFMLLCLLYAGICLSRACLGLMNAAGWIFWRDITICKAFPFTPF